MDSNSSNRRIALLLEAVCMLVSVGVAGCQGSARIDPEAWLRQRLERGAVSAEQSVARAREISKKIEQTYESCSCLSFVVEMHEPDLDLFESAEMSMTPDRLKSNIYIGGKKVLVYTLVGTKFQEWIAEKKSSPAKQVMHHLESHDSSKPITLFDGLEPYGCAFGFYANNQLGLLSRKREFFVDRTAAGYYVGQEIIDGRLCDVVVCPPNERFWGQEALFVRPDGFLARRESWEFIDGTKRRLIRVFDFRRLATRPVPESTWRFETAPPPMEKMKEIR